jgi:uncharacterized protein
VTAARSSAHPRPGRRLPAAVFNARLTARLTPRGAKEIARAPRSGSLVEIRDCKRSLLVTFRRDGTPVPTPVWAAEAGGRFYVRTERTAGKVKRLRNDPRLLVAPCTVRGRPLGAPLEAIGRMLSEDDEPFAERTLATRYGLGRAIFEWAMDTVRVDMGYLEVTPGTWNN